MKFGILLRRRQGIDHWKDKASGITNMGVRNYSYIRINSDYYYCYIFSNYGLKLLKNTSLEFSKKPIEELEQKNFRVS